MHKLHAMARLVGADTAVVNGLQQLTNPSQAAATWTALSAWRVVINYRATGRLGQCCHREREITISDVLLKPEYRAKLRNTLLHEVAHAVDVMLHGRSSGHGLPWQRIMRAFGEVPQRCSTDQAVNEELNKKRMIRAKIIWACQRCEQEVPILKRRRSPAEYYSHSKCGGKFYVKRDACGRTHPNPSK